MARIERTTLPGVGVRHDFFTEEGMRIGIIHRRTGRRELFVCPPGDPDKATLTLELTDDEAHTLVDVLGGSQVVVALGRLQQEIEGLAIDWLNIDEGSVYGGRSIGDARIRTRTGVSVVAVLRDGNPFPAPGPDFTIEEGDTMVVVGTAEGIETVRGILRSG